MLTSLNGTNSVEADKAIGELDGSHTDKMRRNE